MASSLTATVCAITWASGVVLTLPAAITDTEKQTGLSGQDESTGLAFIWQSAESRPVWMRNTRIPLSAGWIDDSGQLTEIMQLDPYDETIRWSREPAEIMIELPRGGFRSRGIEIGDRISRVDCSPTEDAR